MRNENISAYQLEKETGVSNSLISQWKAHRQNPSVKNIKKLAKYFNVPWEMLMADEDEPESPSKDAFEKAMKDFEETTRDKIAIYVNSKNSEIECINKLELLNEFGIKRVSEYIVDLSGNPKYAKNEAEK